MLNKVVWAKALPEHQIYLKFQDGVEGTINFSSIAPFKGVFAPLQDQKNFEKMALNLELGTIQWDRGVDLAPETLYDFVTGKIR